MSDREEDDKIMKNLPSELQKKSIRTIYGDAWRYEDLIAVMDCFYNNPIPYLLYGGDVLYNDLSYSSDWFYDYDLQHSIEYNKERSFQKGREYVEMYVNNYGYNVYFTLTSGSCNEGRDLALSQEKAKMEPGIDLELWAKAKKKSEKMHQADACAHGKE